MTPELADALAAVECGVPLFDRPWDELGAGEQALCHVVSRVRMRQRMEMAGIGLGSKSGAGPKSK